MTWRLGLKKTLIWKKVHFNITIFNDISILNFLDVNDIRERYHICILKKKLDGVTVKIWDIFEKTNLF